MVATTHPVRMQASRARGPAPTLVQYADHWRSPYASNRPHERTTGTHRDSSNNYQVLQKNGRFRHSYWRQEVGRPFSTNNKYMVVDIRPLVVDISSGATLLAIARAAPAGDIQPLWCSYLLLF